MRDNNLNYQEENRGFSSLLISFFRIILPPILIVGAILTIRINWFDYLSVSGSSMYPTLQDHQMVLVNKTNKNYKKKTTSFQGKTYTEEEWKAFEQDPWGKVPS